MRMLKLAVLVPTSWLIYLDEIKRGGRFNITVKFSLVLTTQQPFHFIFVYTEGSRIMIRAIFKQFHGIIVLSCNWYIQYFKSIKTYTVSE